MDRVQPEEVYGNQHFTFLEETLHGCPPFWGDRDTMDYRVVGEGPWAEVGEAHALARHEANRLRSLASARRAFARARPRPAPSLHDGHADHRGVG